MQGRVFTGAPHYFSLNAYKSACYVARLNYFHFLKDWGFGTYKVGNPIAINAGVENQRRSETRPKNQNKHYKRISAPATLASKIGRRGRDGISSPNLAVRRGITPRHLQRYQKKTSEAPDRLAGDDSGAGLP